MCIQHLYPHARAWLDPSAYNAPPPSVRCSHAPSRRPAILQVRTPISPSAPRSFHGARIADRYRALRCVRGPRSRLAPTRPANYMGAHRGGEIRERMHTHVLVLTRSRAGAVRRLLGRRHCMFLRCVNVGVGSLRYNSVRLPWMGGVQWTSSDTRCGGAEITSMQHCGRRGAERTAERET